MLKWTPYLPNHNQIKHSCSAFDAAIYSRLPSLRQQPTEIADTREAGRDLTRGMA